MAKVDDYRSALRGMTDWDGWLKANSGLPGPRGNLELAQAAALEGDETRFETWRSMGIDLAPVNSPEEFLVFCGVLGLWRQAAGGEQRRAHRPRYGRPIHRRSKGSFAGSAFCARRYQ